jgi:hypothetical protein
MRGPLKFLAALLGTLMVVMPFAGLDSLPRAVRSQIVQERKALAGAQSAVRSASDEVSRDLSSERALFDSITADDAWPRELDASASDLDAAQRDMAQLTTLEKADRRGDRARVEQLLSHERPLRNAAETRANKVRQDAAHWVELKRNLPATLQQMERDYAAVRGFDASAAAAAVQKASNDWPEKKSDLEARLGALRSAVTQSETEWQTSAAVRRQAAAGQIQGLDFGVLLTAADTLHSTAASLQPKAAELTALTGQLYTVWDKVLVDLDDSKKAQKIRTVTTKDGSSRSDEQWVEVPASTYAAMKDNLGMSIVHKGTGKYDSEAERVAQPAGFAYIAPPSQGRNQYGYWDHRDGRDFWVFYGQYALMRDLLFNRDYRPLDRGDYEGYRTSREQNQTYYGQQGSGGKTYGTSGAATQQRYKDSKYASKSGNYRSSDYASPSMRDPNVDRAPKRFGNGSSPQAAPPPTRSYRPAPSYRPSPRSSPPRRFGRR